MIHKRSVIFKLFICLNSLVFGQKIEFSSGVLSNYFFDLQHNEGHYYGEFKEGFGYTFSLFADEILVDTLPFPWRLRFGLKYTNYNGRILVRDGGMGGSSTTSADVTMNIFGLDFYPLNISCKGLKVNIGFEINCLLRSKEIGSHSKWQMYQPSTYSEFDTIVKGRFEDRSFGLIGRFAYDIKLNKNWFIIPQYCIYFSLGREKIDCQEGILSLRQSLEVGIARKIK